MIHLQERMTPLGNKHGEEITLRGITLWGRDALLRILTIISIGDSADKLRWGWITIARDIESVED